LISGHPVFIVPSSEFFSVQSSVTLSDMSLTRNSPGGKSISQQFYSCLSNQDYILYTTLKL